MARSGRPHARARVPCRRSRSAPRNGHRLGAGGAGDQPSLHARAEPLGRARRCVAGARQECRRPRRSVAGAATLPCLYLRWHSPGRHRLGGVPQGISAAGAGRSRTHVRAPADGRLRAGVLPGGGAGAARTQLQHHRPRAGVVLRRRADRGAACGRSRAGNLRAGRRARPIRSELPAGARPRCRRPGAHGARARARRRPTARDTAQASRR